MRVQELVAAILMAMTFDFTFFELTSVIRVDFLISSSKDVDPAEAFCLLDIDLSLF